MTNQPAFSPDNNNPMTALLNNSTDGIIIVDTKGTILFVNPAAAEIFGRPYESLVNSDLGLPLQKGEKTQLEILNRTNGLRRAELMISATHWYEQPVYLAVLHDITRETEAEKQREELERRFTEIFQITPEPILVTSLEEGIVLDANPAFLAVMQRSRKECLGKGSVELGLWPNKDERDGFMRQLCHKGKISGQARTIPIAGHERSFLVSSSLLEHEGERSILTLMRDITDIRHQQHRLHNAKQEAERANQAKSHFLANMSHEIRTPMNAIIGSSHILLNSEMNKEQQEFVHTIIQSGSHLLTLIDDILDFSKIEAGKMEVKEEPFDLDKLSGEVIDLISHKAQGKELELVYHVAPDVPGQLIGDAAHLRQILVNLVGNAVKFTARGEVVVKCLTEEWPQLQDGKPGQDRLKLRFQVTDTGIGIPQDKLHRLFSPFSQADDSASRSYGGTGLGLSIVKRLTDLQGGTVEVESVKGEGSSFSVVLPFTLLPETAESQEHGLHLSSWLQGRRVLVVDDSPAVRELFHGLLTSAGAAVEEAADLHGARRRLQATEPEKAPYSLLILDAGLSREATSGFVREAQARAAAQGLHTLLLLEQSASGTVRQHYTEAYEAVLMKPVTRTKCTTLLYDIARKSRARDAVETTDTPESPRAGTVPRQTAAAGNYFPAHGPDIAAHGPDTAAAAGSEVRVLVVEDNAINCKIAVRTIEKRGYKAETATNGQEALRAVRKQRYNLILMDVRMPNMNGLEATGFIRQSSSGATAPDVPIIAMTAFSYAEDREECLQAGMNDYLAKPVMPEELIKKLETWLPDDNQDASQSGRTGPRTGSGIDAPNCTTGQDPAESSIFDSLTFQEITHGDPEHIRELIEAFSTDIPAQIQQIKSALQSSRWMEIARLAHGVKGAALTLCAKRLSDTAQQLELAAQSAAAAARRTGLRNAEAGTEHSPSASPDSPDLIVRQLEQEYQTAAKVMRRIHTI